VKSHFPYRPDRQVFRITKEHDDGTMFHIRVLFKYLPDERTIYLTEIASQIEP
jgi:hypothetical protein